MELCSRLLQWSYAILIGLYIPFLLQQMCDLFLLTQFISFFVLVLFGLLCIGISLLSHSQALSIGFMLAGLRCTVIGSWPYWYKVGDHARFFAALLVLIVLLYAWYRVAFQSKGK